ncbi:MAG: hypothetical protein CM15mP79_1120 [Methanobacteriota archaeon]|nr:MAG: hypothetical protein CM15mP79_1120 [Euryarchaeota archaeon]
MAARPDIAPLVLSDAPFSVQWSRSAAASNAWSVAPAFAMDEPVLGSSMDRRKAWAWSTVKRHSNISEAGVRARRVGALSTDV